MGWRLAEEVAWARPERPGPEWWTLLDLAQDASDETRQGWPGHEYLTTRAKASRRTIDRRISTLIDGGLITVAKKAAPGRRVIYEIPALHDVPVDNPATCDSVNGTRQRATNDGQRATETGQRATLTPNAVTSGNAATSQVTESGSVAHPPSLLPSLSPSDQKVLTSPVPVERARDENSERNRQLDALEAWIRDHTQAEP